MTAGRQGDAGDGGDGTGGSRPDRGRDDHDHDHAAGDHEHGTGHGHVRDGNEQLGADGAATARLSVPGMDCASCAEKVERGVTAVDGVHAVDPQVTTGSVVVSYDADRASPAAITDGVERAGYDVVETDRDGDDGGVWTSRRALRTWAGTALLAVGLALEFLLQTGIAAEVLGRELTLADGVFLASVAVAGGPVVRNGYRSALTRSLDVDLLMTVAIGGALLASLGFGESLYFEAATLASLFSVAELLERYSMDRARHSLRELMELSPDTATVRRDGTTETVPVEDIAVGETVLVDPGERVPMDGVVSDGESAVDQSPVTGESVPVEKRTGDEVFAGTVNETGALVMEVTAEAADNTIARVARLVEEARSNRTEREQFVDRFAAYYTPAVVVAAALTAVVPPLAVDGTATLAVGGLSYTVTGAWTPWFVRGLTLLVLACPCAFVLSTPVSVVSGVTSAARNGVLVKGGDHLEAVGGVEAVALDKTGTLTRGELAVTDVVSLSGASETEVLELARSLEARSEHPIGAAVVEYAADHGVETREVEGFRSITGKGVRAEVDGVTHYAGKPGLFEDLGVDLSHVHAATDGGVIAEPRDTDACDRADCLDLASETVPELQAEGKTVVLVGTADRVVGVIAVADEVRPEARRAVERLHELGVAHVAMLTGDNERTARAIAEAVGVDEVRAELLPEEKVDAVRDLGERHDGVAMVGDGINDAPALATATVGVAMGAAGTDTAIETADVALMGDDLSRLPYLVDLARRTDGVIRQNVWASLGAKAVLAAGVPFGLVPVWLAVLAGDAGMTTAVTANATRLSRVKPESEDD